MTTKRVFTFFETYSVIFSVIIVAAFWTFFAIKSASILAPNNHFSLQAQAFLHGSLAVTNPPASLNDLAFFHNKYYVPFGPLPAILLTPFVALFGLTVSQQWLGYFCAFFSFVLIFRIAGKMGIANKITRLWLATAFIFGTVYISLIVLPISAYLVQVIAVFFILLSLNEFFGKKRFWLIGLYIGCAILTRSIVGFAIVFFLWEIFSISTLKKKLQATLLLIVPIIICSILLFSFNYARFGTFLDNGYDHNISHGQDLLLSRSQGFFSLRHVPGNLYLLLFKAPDPIKLFDQNYVLKFPYLHVDPWGLSIFFTTPLFLYILLVHLKEKHVKASLFAIFMMLLPTVTYYAYGVWQYGYRHAVDFYPFLFLLLFPLFKERLPVRAKLLICYSIVFNFSYMLSLWGIYFLRQQ